MDSNYTQIKRAIRTRKKRAPLKKVRCVITANCIIIIIITTDDAQIPITNANVIASWLYKPIQPTGPNERWTWTRSEAEWHVDQYRFEVSELIGPESCPEQHNGKISIAKFC